MAEQESSGDAQIRDRRVSPAGLLPKNTQAWVIGGLSVVMAAIIAFSGSKAPTAKKTELPKTMPTDPNQARIEEYQRRIEEQTRRLQEEQAQLLREGNAVPLSGPFDDQVTASRQARSYDPPESDGTTQRAQRVERERREEESLFSSNIALSYRTPGASRPAIPEASASTGQPTDPAFESLSKLLPFMAAMSALQPGTGAETRANTTPGTDFPSKAESSPIRSSPSAAGSSGSSPVASEPALKGYRVFEGTVIETVLTNRLDGSFSGPVNAMVTTPLYSRDGQHVLVPSGTRVLGGVQPVTNLGQQRLAVVFHRLIMPDGYSVSLDQFQGLNQIGETGLRDKINHHYFQVFGMSLAIGAIAGLGHANSRTGSDPSALDAYEQGVTSSLSQSSLRILDRYLNVLPTFTIREGHRIKLLLAGDLVLPAYGQHTPGGFGPLATK